MLTLACHMTAILPHLPVRLPAPPNTVRWMCAHTSSGNCLELGENFNCSCAFEWGAGDGVLGYAGLRLVATRGVTGGLYHTECLWSSRDVVRDCQACS